MRQPTAVHDTSVLERHYALPADAVFEALTDPLKKRRWYADGERPAERFEMDFRVGGAERVVFRLGDDTPFPGTEVASEGRYEDIEPSRRVVVSSTMRMGERRILTALVTIELLALDRGTDLILTHQAVFYEGADGPDMRKEGWVTLLAALDRELGLPAGA